MRNTLYAVVIHEGGKRWHASIWDDSNPEWRGAPDRQDALIRACEESGASVEILDASECLSCLSDPDNAGPECAAWRAAWRACIAHAHGGVWPDGATYTSGEADPATDYAHEHEASPIAARDVALRENRARREWHHARAALCEARGLTHAAEGWRRLCGCNACVPRDDDE